MDLTNKTLSELRAIATELGVTPDGNRGWKRTWISAIESATCDRQTAPNTTAYFSDEQPPNRGDGKGRIEAIELSLTSMCEWAPCPDEWYEPNEIIETVSSTLESPGVEQSEVPSLPAAKFFIPVFSDRNSEEPPTAGVGARLPRTGGGGFPPTVVRDRGGRSPPGGDVKTM